MPTVERRALADGSFQHHLLRDAARLDAFAKALALVVRPGDVVADLGAGSGVLAALAVRAGARRVYAVEQDRGALAHLEALLARNGVGAARAVEGDAARWVPPEPVDVVVCELMETGLLHEPVAEAMRNAHGWSPRPRAMVPSAATLLVEGVALRDVFHGYAAPLPGFRAAGSGGPLTTAAPYAQVDFQAGPVPEGVEAEVGLEARSEGEVGALRLRTETTLAPGIVAHPSEAFCTPVVLPLPEPLRVRAGQRLRARVRYGFAYDAGPLAYDLQA